MDKYAGRKIGSFESFFNALSTGPLCKVSFTCLDVDRVTEASGIQSHGR
jgi:hypothetical protein